MFMEMELLEWMTIFFLKPRWFVIVGSPVRMISIRGKQAWWLRFSFISRVHIEIIRCIHNRDFISCTIYHQCTELVHVLQCPYYNVSVSLSLFQCHYVSLLQCFSVALCRSLLQCLSFTMCPCHSVSVSTYVPVTMFHCHPMSLFHCFSVTMCLCYNVSVSPCVSATVFQFHHVTVTMFQCCWSISQHQSTVRLRIIPWLF